jgi:cytochrome c
MDLWTFNKLAGAILASLLVIVGANTAVEVLYPTGGPGEFTVVEVEGEDETQTADMTETDATSDQQAEAEKPLPVLLAAADPQAGQKTWRQCSACHVNEEGGPNRVGPNLYGVVGREVASVDGFGYSNALEEYGGEWTYERLDCFLENPSGCVKGTSMGYAGIKKPADRADMIAYLASLGDAPPFPELEAEQQEAAAQPDAEAEAVEDAQETVAEPAAEEAEQAAAEPAKVEQDTAEASVAEMEQSAEEREATAQASDETAAANAGDAGASAETDAQAAGDDKAGDGESKLAALLASGDAAEGQKAARACSACHTFDEGGPNRVGPNLYGVVGREVASVDGFRYSDALKGYGDEWSYERLDCYLKNPRECVPGNKMTYAGVKDDAKRADIIAYLASLGDAPPLPGDEQDTGQADQPGGENRSARMQPPE